MGARVLNVIDGGHCVVMGRVKVEPDVVVFTRRSCKPF